MSKKTIHRSLIYGVIISVVLLVSYRWIKPLIYDKDNNDLIWPNKWLWLSLTPTLLGLLFSDYIKELKVGSFSICINPPDLKEYHMKSAPELPSTSKQQQPVGNEKHPDDSALVNIYQEWIPYKKIIEGYNEYSYFLVHKVTRSKTNDKRFDVWVYLMRDIRGRKKNQVSGFSDVEQAEFYFGESWGNSIVVKNNWHNKYLGRYIGVKTDAWGSFLAICCLTLRKKYAQRNGVEKLYLYRYIDFEMLLDQ